MTIATPRDYRMSRRRRRDLRAVLTRATKPTSVLTSVAMSVLVCCSMTACGSGNGVSQGHSSTAGTATGAGSTSAVTGGQTGGQVSALSAEAQSLATGDIPDSQVFLTFRDPRSGYALRYPEGWAQRGIPGGVTFVAKNNLIRL